MKLKYASIIFTAQPAKEEANTADRSHNPHGFPDLEGDGSD